MSEPPASWRRRPPPAPVEGGEGTRATLSDVTRVLRDRWWLILLCVFATGAAASIVSVRQDRVYEATTSLLFRQNTLPQQVGGAGAPADLDPDSTRATNVLLLSSINVARSVDARLKLRETPEDLLDVVEVESESTADVVSVTVSDEDPRRAALIADTWAAVFIELSRRNAREYVQQGQRLIRDRLDALPADAATERQQLTEALNRLVLIEAVQIGAAEVLDPALVPDAPSTPRPKRNAAVGAIFGLLLGAGLALLFNAFDRRLKDIGDIENAYGLRALASVPEGILARRGAEPLEPFRILRGALSFLVEGESVGALVVTSAVPGEGKTTVAAGLARAASLAGTDVVLVEADLRRPALGSVLGDPSRRGGDPSFGLADVLAGRLSLVDALVAAARPHPTLTILRAGTLPPNPAELLAGPRMADVLAQLQDDFGLVILDAPPLLPVADTHELLDHEGVDACLVVARAYRTKRDEVLRTRTIIARHAVPVGLVVNGLRRSEAGYDSYYGPSRSGLLRRRQNVAPGG